MTSEWIESQSSRCRRRRREDVVVLDQPPRVAVTSRRRRRIGRPVRRLDAHDLAAGDHEVERAHKVRERPPGEAGAVCRGRDDAGDRLGVVAAHVRQREAARGRARVELAQRRAAEHARERAVARRPAQASRRRLQQAAELSRLDEIAVGQRDVGPGVAGADAAHGGALALGAPHERDELLERPRVRRSRAGGSSGCRCGSPGRSGERPRPTGALPRSASAAIVFEGLTPSAVGTIEPSSTRARERRARARASSTTPVVRVVGHRAAAERVDSHELCSAGRPRARRTASRPPRRPARGRPLEVGEQRRAARLAPADVKPSEQPSELHPAVGGVAADHQEYQRVGVRSSFLREVQVARAHRLVAPAHVHERGRRRSSQRRSPESR